MHSWMVVASFVWLALGMPSAGGGARRTHRSGFLRPFVGLARGHARPGGTADRGWQTCWDWWKNRALLFETYKGGIIARGGQPGFAKVVEGMWQMPWVLDGRLDGQPVAYVYGSRGKLAMPPEGELSKNGVDLVIRLRSLSRRGRQSLSVRMGRRLVGRRPLAGDRFETLRFALPAGSGAPGLVRDISLRFQRVVPISVPVPDWRSVGVYGLKYKHRVLSAAAVSAVAFVPRNLPVPDEVLAGSFMKKGAGARGTFLLPPGGGLRLYQVLPTTARLRLVTAGKGRIEVRARTDKPSSVVVASYVPGGRGPAAKTLSLAKWAGRPVALDVTCLGPGPCRVLQAAIQSRPQPARSIARPKPKYVFFWVADTLRRDSVGAYGSRIVKTPNFDALARRGVLFERSIIQGNHSLPSHASILTGRYPPVHTLEHAKARVRGTLLFEPLHAAGWFTSLLSANGYVSTKWGYRRGIDEYFNFIRRGYISDAEHVWRRTRRTIERHLARRPGRPLFMYILTIDPHVTYRPPAEYRKIYYPGRYRGRLPRRITGFDLNKLITGVLKVRTKDDMRYLKALYRGEITYNDHWFGVMMAELKRMGILDQSLIVVTSDHGDEFREHGSFGHAKSLYQENIAVPLIMWWKGLEKAGPIRIPYNVEVQDIYSTILDLVGLPQPASAQSASLIPLIMGGRAEPTHAAFAYHAGSMRSVTVTRFKYIVGRKLRRQLFDLDHDPGEQHNILTVRPVTLMAAKSLLAIRNAYVGKWNKRRWGDAFDLRPAFYRDLSR